MASKKTFDDLDLSQEEIKRIETALKDEKFRKMFVEYAEEISNPENRKRYEEEIAMMEQERGMDVQFVNPKPGHVMKTADDSGKKVFINICTSDKIGTPSSTKQTDAEGRRGLHWQIPHSFSPPREDFDEAKSTCMVYDVVFHPDTYRMSSNPRFKKLIEDTAVDGIERQFAIKLDRNNVKRPKIQYKGHPVATVIRNRKDNGDSAKVNQEPDDVLKNMPYPYENKTSAELAAEKLKQAEKKANDKKTKEDKTKLNTQKREEDTKDGYTIPKYTITHRSDLELQQFTNAPDSRPTTRPTELIINIQLPLCKSAAGVDLDIFEDKLTLQSEKPAYKLELKLPYPVEDENGTAKFDKSKKSLVITLPTVKVAAPKMPSFIEENTSAEIPPLIEELPPLEEVDEIVEKVTVEESKEEPKSNIPEQSDSKNASQSAHSISYSVPPYDFNQDIETVTFVFHVKNVSEDSVSKSYPAPGSSEIKFASVGSGGFPWHYALYVKFEDGNAVVPEHSTVDVSDKNVTWTLLKSRQSRTMWNKFCAGLDGQSAEEKLFLTTDNLSLQLEDLKAEGEAMVQTQQQQQQQGSEGVEGEACRPKLHVTQMNTKKLTIKIGNPKLSLSEEDEEGLTDDESPSSADIQVIHRSAPPNLQGILKQRSTSESSEDHSSSSTSESSSPRDSDAPRHVTFNSHIDKTTYKSNMSVSSMKQALKSKRRRNRKKEEKRAAVAGRRRHNSNGSECSSCDEVEQRLGSGAESHSSEDDRDGLDELAEQMEETGKKVEDSGVIAEAAEETVGEPEDKKQEDEAKADVEVKSKAAVKNKRSEAKAKQSGGKKGNIAQQVKVKLAEGKCDAAVDSDDDNDGDDVIRTKVSNVSEAGVKNEQNAQKMVDRTNMSDDKVAVGADVDLSGVTDDGKKVNVNKAAAGDNNDTSVDLSGKPSAIITEGEGDPPADGLKTGKIVENLKKEEGMHEKGQGGSEGVSEKKESTNVVETDLTWNEGRRAAPGSEHRSDCAFEFSNAVMYDLDID